MKVYLYVSIRKDYVYQCTQLPWMQSSSVRVVYWKREFPHLPLHKEVSKDKIRFCWSTCCFSVALIIKKHRYFPGICDAARGRALTTPIPGLCFQWNSMFFYTLLKSAANAVLNFMSAVIAIAHVLFVSIKSLSLNFMLLEYSFGKLKYDSTFLPMSSFSESSPISASRSPVSLVILTFSLIIFQCG